MGDNVDSDLLYDDINQNIDNNDSYNDQGDDLYDDVLTSNNTNINDNNSSQEHINEVETNGNYQGGNMHHSSARRHQLYIGNLTWWTTDQDITDAVIGVGVQDFQEVKFFENRANGQSKGFCVITLGSEGSMRLVMENLSKKELNGQNPVVALPTKQALNQFESQQKTRPTPPNGNPQITKTGPGGGMGGMGGGERGMGGPNPNNMSHGLPPRMMGNPMMRGPGMNSGMNHGPPPNMRPMNHNQQMPQRFQNNWNGPPRGPGMPLNRPPMNPGPGMMNQRAPMGMSIQRPRPEQWNNGGRPPMHHGNFPPRGPPLGPPNHGAPAPHVNPAFFQGAPGPMQGMPPNFNQGGPPRNSPWPGPNVPPAAQPPISEAEFEEIMGRNRTVSSSAIARAVSDAAAGEYASAIETLATAISLIKQSKVANDERCKILITSLQDTLQGIESKSYRRERSDRSRSRERRSRRRERSSSRGYSRRSRSREHRDHRDRNRDERYYASENYHGNRERSRSRDRGTSDYRGDEARRPRKSPEASNETNSDNFKRSYDDRNRESDRERYQNRERGDTRSRH